MGVLVAGCGGSGHPAARTPAATRTPGPAPTGRAPAANGRAGTPDDADALRRLLARRADALLRGDPRELAATSTGAQVRRDRRDARRARRLPLRSVGLDATSVELRGRRAALRVQTAYTFGGVGSRFFLDRRVRAVRTRRGWRIAADGAGGREHAPWELTRYRTERTRHFLVLVPAGLATPGLGEALEAGRRRLAAALPAARPPAHLLVVVATGAAQAGALTRSIRGVDGLTALSDAAVREEGPARRVVAVASQRVVVLWPALSALGADGRMRIVAHELTHAGLAAKTSGRTPAWLVEGVALYASGDDRSAEAGARLQTLAAGGGTASERRAMSLRGLARPAAIGRLSGDAQGAAYAYASAAAFTVTAAHGRHALLALLRVFDDTSLRGRAGPALQRRAIRRVLGVSAGRLAAEVRARAAQAAGG